MKKAYLVCNAHLDHIWQWTWEEGAAEALSTFKSAADLLEEYDFTFCHNEAALYEFIEKYNPKLFERIRDLIAQGKWRIMGGWCLQPDVLLPQGESIIRQIRYGKKFFQDKFGVEPTTAVNVDSFGHSRGLVQILVKNGQDSYWITRPWKPQLAIKGEAFTWRGYDDSEVKVCRTDSYVTFLGKTAEYVQEQIEKYKDEEAIMIPWGVGNHGGGPSRKDLNDLKELFEKSDVEIVHSYPEEALKNMPAGSIWDKSLISCMPGCYTALVQMKQKYIELENLLYATEKMATTAYLNFSSFTYPQAEIDLAVKNMINAQFHDVLSGTVIRSGEKNAMNRICQAINVLQETRAECFFFLARNLAKCAPGEYCIAVFNHHPYKTQENVCFEFTMEKNSNDEIAPLIELFDEKGEKLQFQVIKEESNVSIDCRKRIIFDYTLNPLAIHRFRLKTSWIPAKAKKVLINPYSLTTDFYSVQIDEKTGLLKSFVCDGVEQVKSIGFGLYVYDDNEDPWAMDDSQLIRLGENPIPVGGAMESKGLFSALDSICVTEEGPLQRTVEALFSYGDSKFVIDYVLWKNRPYIDMKLKAFWLNRNKMLKLHVPMANQGEFRGRQMFGEEELYNNGRECVAQGGVTYGLGEKRFGILSGSNYGYSLSGNTICISLLRSATYCAHPVEDKPTVYYDRYLDIIDLGETNFSFRMGVFETESFERNVYEFLQPSFALSMCPTGEEYEKTKGEQVFIEDKDIVLTALKKCADGNGIVARLFNNSEKSKTTEFTIGKIKTVLQFGKYEVKTLLYQDDKIVEQEQMIV